MTSRFSGNSDDNSLSFGSNLRSWGFGHFLVIGIWTFLGHWDLDIGFLCVAIPQLSVPRYLADRAVAIVGKKGSASCLPDSRRKAVASG
jgi:hypothetical protein